MFSVVSVLIVVVAVVVVVTAANVSGLRFVRLSIRIVAKNFESH